MKRFIALAVLALISACKEAPPSQNLPPLAFAGPVMRIDVAQINVVESYQSPMGPPNIEHQFPIPPAQGVKQWAGQRLQAVGRTGTLEIVVEDASVKEVPLEKKKGVTGFFTDDQSERYDANLRVVMRLYSGAQAMSDAEGNVAVSRSRTINEKATLAQREKLFYDISDDMLKSFDREAELRLRQYFGNFLR